MHWAVLSRMSPDRQRFYGWVTDASIQQTGGYFYSRALLMLINGVLFFFVMVAVGMPWALALPLSVFEAFLAETLPALAELRVPTVVSLAATRPEEFGPMTQRLFEAGRDHPCWHGVELNLSCPNVADGGHDFGSDPATVAACVAAARPQLPDRALIAKLTPNVARIAPLAAALELEILLEPGTGLGDGYADNVSLTLSP